MSLSGKQVKELQSLYESVYASKDEKEDIILTNEEFKELCDHILSEAFDAIVLDEVVKKFAKTAANNPGLRSKALDLMKTAASKVFATTKKGQAVRIGGAAGVAGLEGATGGKNIRHGGSMIKNLPDFVGGTRQMVNKDTVGAGMLQVDRKSGDLDTTKKDRDIKKIQQKVKLNNSFEFNGFNLYIVEEEESIEDLRKKFNKKSNKVKVTPFKDTSMGKSKPNDNIKNKEEKSKLSNIPPEEGSDKKFNPDFGKKSEINKVDTNKVDTNKVDTNQNNVVKKGPDLDAIGKYSRNREVTMKDFESKPEVVKPTNPSGKVIPKPIKPLMKNSPAAKAGIPLDMRQKFANQNAAFQATKNKDSGYTKMDFIKDFPRSQTAKKFNKGQPIPGFSNKNNLKNSYEPYDLVLDYVLSEGHADTVEEAHYIMMQMDEESIKSILNITEGVVANTARLAGALTVGGLGLNAIKKQLDNKKKMEKGGTFKQGSMMDNIQKKNQMLKDM